jgi:hypothetical protein
MRKNKAFPKDYFQFDAKIKLTDKEFETVLNGKISRSMDEKWNIIFNDGWLYFHRSWTGKCIYKVKVEKFDAVNFITTVQINNSKDEYKMEDVKSEIIIFKEIFQYFLQNKL